MEISIQTCNGSGIGRIPGVSKRAYQLLPAAIFAVSILILLLLSQIWWKLTSKRLCDIAFASAMLTNLICLICVRDVTPQMMTYLPFSKRATNADESQNVHWEYVGVISIYTLVGWFAANLYVSFL
jgi:hypothetical protein